MRTNRVKPGAYIKIVPAGTEVRVLPRVHELKILPEYFEEVLKQNKRFELRKDDRDWEVGDAILLKEWDGEEYTGRVMQLLTIRYILRDCSEYGLQEGYCILGF